MLPVNEKYKAICKLLSKDIYWILVDKKKCAYKAKTTYNGMNKVEEKICKEIYLLAYQTTSETKVQFRRIVSKYIISNS